MAVLKNSEVLFGRSLSRRVTSSLANASSFFVVSDFESKYSFFKAYALEKCNLIRGKIENWEATK